MAIGIIISMVLIGGCLRKIFYYGDVHKIRLDGRRGKLTAESFCDPGWCVYKSDVQNTWGDYTERERLLKHLFYYTAY